MSRPPQSLQQNTFENQETPKQRFDLFAVFCALLDPALGSSYHRLFNVEGDLVTIGYLMLDDFLSSHYRLFNDGRFPWIPLLSAI